jgi:type II secretory pathway pseudopilin PulG
MLKKYIKKSETLLEIIVAIVIIGIGASASVAIISSTVRGNEAIKNRIVAINLAREGLEVFINQRDTNIEHANYFANPECWRALRIDDCDSSSEDLWGHGAESIDYIINLNPRMMNFVIEEASADISNSPPEEFQLYKDGDFFVNDITDTDTNFYRAVRVQELSQSDFDSSPNLNFTKGEVLKLTAIVYFKNRTGFSKVETSTILAN